MATLKLKTPRLELFGKGLAFAILDGWLPPKNIFKDFKIHAGYAIITNLEKELDKDLYPEDTYVWDCKEVNYPFKGNITGGSQQENVLQLTVEPQEATIDGKAGLGYTADGKFQKRAYSEEEVRKIAWGDLQILCSHLGINSGTKEVKQKAVVEKSLELWGNL